MKRIILYVIFLLCISFNWVFGGNNIKSNFPVNNLPPPERCASCHKTENIYNEFSSSVHKDMKCFDCHLPAKIQKEKYSRKDRGFYRLGYHKQKQDWDEFVGNEACVRCHDNNVMADSEKKCWSCHMPEKGNDRIFILKNPMKPFGKDNIREVKTIPHRSHNFKVHPKK